MSCKKSVNISAKLPELYNFFAEIDPHANHSKQISFKRMNREWVDRSEYKSKLTFDDSDVIFQVIMIHVHDPFVDMSYSIQR